MKKSKFMLCVSAAMLLASCGGQPSTGASSGESKASGTSTETSQATSVSSEESKATSSKAEVEEPEIPWADIETEDVDLLVWCDTKIKNITTVEIENFVADLKAAGFDKEITYNVVEVSESKAAGDMITDVESGADVYFFAQDQLSRLVTAQAIDEVPALFEEYVEYINTDAAVSAGVSGDTLYAYPATADNGYFLYYDTSKLTEEQASSWESIVEVAEAGQYEIDFEHSNAWYNFGFFYGAGADCEFKTDAAGNFVEYVDTYDSAAGLAAARGLSNLVSSPTVVSNSGIANAGEKCIAIVDGTWDYEAAKTKFGDNLGCAALPTFTVGGQTYHTGSFSGNKLVGVKPQDSECRAIVSHLLALELTDAAAQEERFDAVGWGPSNLEVAASDKIQNAPHLAALFEQNQYAKPQGQYPDLWWTTANAIGTGIQGLGKNPTDEQLRTVIQLYKDALPGMVE